MRCIKQTVSAIERAINKSLRIVLYRIVKKQNDMRIIYTVENIRISTDILWGVFHIFTEPIPHTFVSVYRRNNEAGPTLHGSVKIWKTHHKISVDIRIFLQCNTLVKRYDDAFAVDNRRPWKDIACTSRITSNEIMLLPQDSFHIYIIMIISVHRTGYMLVAGYDRRKSNEKSVGDILRHCTDRFKRRPM